MKGKIFDYDEISFLAIARELEKRSRSGWEVFKIDLVEKESIYRVIFVAEEDRP